MQATFELDRDKIVYKALDVVDAGPPVLLKERLYRSKDNAQRVAERSQRIANAEQMRKGEPHIPIERFFLGTLVMEVADA